MSTIARTAAGAPVASTATGGPAGAGPAAGERDHLVGVGPHQRLAPRIAAQRQPALLEVDHQHLGAALARHQADALADRPRAQHHHALAGLDRRRGRTARTAIDTGSAIAATAASATAIGNTWSWAVDSRSCRPPSTWIPISSKLSQVLGRPTLHG